MSPIPDLRPSPIAGMWYAGDPKTLETQVDGFIQQAMLPELEGEVLGVIAPHAGHRYSGRTAGHAFRAVLGVQRDLVVVVSPLHAYAPAPLLTTAHQGYKTPLGPVWVDREVVEALDERLRSASSLKLTAIANDNEHSLEIELPFLQRALKGEFRLLPLMVHSHSTQIARSLGEALAEALSGHPSFLLVASTDLSHFTPEPVANELDDIMLNQIESFSPEGVMEAELSGHGLACGAVPVAAVLWAARQLGANVVKVVHHSTSGDETGDRSSVVGYGAAVILRK